MTTTDHDPQIVQARDRMFAFAFLAAIAFFALPAQAYIGPPSISPATPLPDQPVTLFLPSGVCDTTGESIGDPNGGVPQITVAGTDITVLFYGTHALNADLCIYPERTTSLVIGSFAPGTYTIHVQFYYDNGQPVTEDVGDMAMTVGGAGPALVAPTLAPAVEVGFALIVFGLGLLAIRHPRVARPPYSKQRHRRACR